MMAEYFKPQHSLQLDDIGVPFHASEVHSHTHLVQVRETGPHDDIRAEQHMRLP